MKLLVTGSSGFVGSAFVEFAESRGDVCIKQRRSLSGESDNTIFLADLSSSTDWSLALKGVECVVHCAAIVHQMKGVSEIDIYRRANTEGTLVLARQAAEAGVKRFVFVSSIKVNGETTDSGSPFKSDVLAAPSDPYGLSKFEAEQHLRLLSQETGLEVVIIRPTLVYGPGVKANFASLMNLVSKGVPLPFACITQNKRSFVSVTNLVDLIITCIDHPKAANQTFLVSDDCDVSTSQMIREMARALDKPRWQLPVPIWCYKLVGKLFNKSNVVDRLIGSLQVDISHTKEILGWTPPQTLEEGFKKTAEAFLQSKKNSGKI
ncbi:UDP-glucose 4-epimerase family protein [Vibrio anguillarum]|uniref:NAD-dependent dehydratase n=1 Tax=Vibrio ordalii FS-238 TaxID=617133 RepID=A0A853R3J2_9VIBR|nr:MULTISPECIES: SDR family oxidoreductase [Vibrio]MDF9388195.1 SDR family oxidoreductase [Vibrio sp. 1151_11]MDQ2192072.1 SDR family oxidoreductase [Vibrio sp. A14(2019)]MDQ2197053.1 SDR family oxidoreductase [Vibrio sp. 2017_1457_11]NNN76242.1 SDR family oxidoreductase [Vibrio sp. B7]NNN92833.1 SDR family oxidoreductase [Vibrio sp. B8-1]